MFNCYGIKDNKVGGFVGQPFFAKNLIEAVRNLTGVVNDPQSVLNRFSEDYSVYQICEYDEQEGVVSVQSSPKFVMNIIELKKGAV
jgi:hypothetical protein